MSRLTDEDKSSDRLTKRARYELVPPLPIPVYAVDLRIMRFDNHDRHAAFAVIPDDHLLPMCSSQQVLVLSIPLYLRPRCAPSTQAHERPVPRPEVPSADTCVHGYGRHEVRVESMPVDIRDGAGVGVDGLVETLLSGKIPY